MIIEKKHFAYLVTQHGRVSHERADFGKWKQAYEASIGSIYANICTVLPRDCKRILDIGSGLGGIDIHLAHHYGCDDTHVCLLDGIDDPPEVEWSFKPHSNMEVAFDFLSKNGVKKIAGIGPGQLGDVSEKFDLVVSFAAYGFHIHPGDYFEDLKKVVHPGTVIVLEIRRTKEDWLRMFVEAFGTPTVLEREKKYVRVAFDVQPK